MARISVCAWRRVNDSAAINLPPDPHVRVVARAAQLARFGALFDRAAGLVEMRAVVEAAVLARLGEFGEVVAQRLRRQVPETELADAGRVDEIRAAAEVVEGGGGGGVAAGAAFVQLAGGDVAAARRAR